MTKTNKNPKYFLPVLQSVVYAASLAELTQILAKKGLPFSRVVVKQ